MLRHSFRLLSCLFVLSLAIFSKGGPPGPSSPTGKLLKELQMVSRSLALLPEQEVQKVLKSQLKQKGFSEEVVKRHPKFFSFVFKVLKHPSALPDFIGAISDFDYLRPYLYGSSILLFYCFSLRELTSVGASIGFVVWG